MLIIKSRFLPKILGILLMMMSVGFAINILTKFLIPEFHPAMFTQLAMLLGALGGIPTIFWPLLKGARVHPLDNQALGLGYCVTADGAGQVAKADGTVLIGISLRLLCVLCVSAVSLFGVIHRRVAEFAEIPQRKTVIRTSMKRRSKSRVFKTDFDGEDLTVMHDLMAAGKAIPAIDKCYKVSEVPEAIRYLEEGHAGGKVVITLESNNET